MAGLQLFLLSSAARNAEYDPNTDSHWLKYGSTIKGTVWLLLVGSQALMAVMFVVIPFRNAADTQSFWSLEAFLLILLLPLVNEIRKRVAVNAQGIADFSPWVGQRTIEWSQVKDVSYSAGSMILSIRTTGPTIRVHNYLSGMHTLIQFLVQHLPSAVCRKGINDYLRVASAVTGHATSYEELYSLYRVPNEPQAEADYETSADDANGSPDFNWLGEQNLDGP